MKSSQHIMSMRSTLLHWYNKEGRTLPWRIRPEDRANGIKAIPYEIWLSEIMCQQTTTTAASAYWHKFLEKWPRVEDLAFAHRDEILSAWAGLGYYARARNLHKCAKIICQEYGGCFPKTEAELLKLPGVGLYTAAAISAICFGAPTNVVDGNVERVISRIFCVKTEMPKAKLEIRQLAAKLADPKQPGDYAQALMDLGAHICKPKNPNCVSCPWTTECGACEAGTMEDYPKRKPKAQRPVRYGAVFYIEDADQIWLQQRPTEGLLGGMMELPGTKWTTAKQTIENLLEQAPFQSNWQQSNVEIKHVFSHFTLLLTVFISRARVDTFEISADLNKLDNYALPSLMRKAIALARTLLPDP